MGILSQLEAALADACDQLHDHAIRLAEDLAREHDLSARENLASGREPA